MKKVAILVLGSGIFLSLSCASPYSPQLAEKCARGLERVSAEFEAAESEGFGGAVKMMKASTLIAAAKVQQQFDKFPNCINKVQRASAYIRQARKQKK